MPRLRRILLFLLLGAAVNILVAWSCARWPVFSSTSSVEQAYDVNIPRSVREREPAPKSDPTESPYKPWRWLRSTQSERGITYDTYTFEREGTETYGYHLVVSFGLPARSLHYQSSPERTPRFGARSAPQRVSGWHGGTTLPRVRWLNPDPGCLYPIAPLPVGFTFNTLFYALLLYLPFATFTTLRRRRRKRLNLCLSCGYPRGSGASPVCPECGTPHSGHAAPSPNPRSE